MVNENHIESGGIKFEIRNEGDLLVFSGDIESLRKLGVGFIESLENQFYFRNDIEKQDFYNGQEQRPQGVFAVKFRNNNLHIENRNNRGDQKTREQLKETIENVRQDLNI